MSFRSMDSRPQPSPNLRLHLTHHRQPTSDHHVHRRLPPSYQDPPANYRFSSSPYLSPPQPPPPSLFSSQPYPPRSIPPPPLPHQSQPPNPNYYQFSLPDAPTHHHPLCSVASNFQYFPPAARNRDGSSAFTQFSRIEHDQDLRSYSGRVERGPTFVSPPRPEEELLRSGTASYGGYDSSCRGRLYGSEVTRHSHELDSVGDGREFRVGSLGYGEQELSGRFSNERRDDSYSRRYIGGPDQSYDVTLVKQVQKRSAFSRLQMPKIYNSPRKVDREWCFGSVYDDKNGSSQLRCKGALLCPEIAVKDSSNWKSVDLNVSFKSNSLVAKPVDPPSSSAFVLDDDSPPKAKRLRSLGKFDRESDCSLLRNKFEEDLQRSNRGQSTGAAATGSRVVPNRGSPAKFNRPNNLMASIKDSSKLSVEKEIEQGTEKLNGFSTAVASTGLIKKETRVEEGIVAAGSGGMCSHSNKNSVKTELRNNTDETRKSVRILNTDNTYPVVQLKAGALSIGKGAITVPEQSVVVVRNKVVFPESDKKYDDLNKDDASATNCESGNGKGEGGKFKMVLKANKARAPLKKDNVLVKKSETGNGKEEGGKVEILVTADQADGSSQSSIKAVSVIESSHVGPTANVSELVDGIVFSDSGEREGQLKKTSFSVADCQVISGTSDVGEPKNVTKAEKSAYSGSGKGKLVVKRRVGTPESGKKPGYSNEYDVLASNSEVGMGQGKFESWGTEKVFKADNVCADRIPTSEAVPMRKVRNGGPKDVISCNDGELDLQGEGTSSGGEAVDANLTTGAHINNIQGSSTLGNFVNGMVPVDSVLDASKSGVPPGQKKRKLSFSDERSRQTSNHEHVSSLPNDDGIFSGRLPTTDEGARLSGIKDGPLSTVTLNATVLSCEKRGNTSLFDDAILLGTNNSVNNSLQIQKIPNCVLLPGCSTVQNKISEPHKVGETKEGCLASRSKNDHNMEIVKIEEMDARASEKQDMGRCEMVQSNCPGEFHLHKVEKIKPHSPLGNLPLDSSFSTSILCATGNEKLQNSDLGNELESGSHPISDRSSSEETEICLRSKVSICKAPLEQFPPQIMDNDSNEQADKPTVPGLSLNADNHPVAHDIPFNSNSAKEIQKDCPILETPLRLLREDFRSSNLCHKGAGFPVEPKPCIPKQRAFPVRSSFISRTSKHNNSTTNYHTWHRTSNVSAFVPGMQPSANVLPMKRNFSGANGKHLDSSYVRKGNSLVWKPITPASHFVPSAVQKLSSLVKLEAENKNGYGKPINSSGYMKLLVSEGTVSSSERPLPPSEASPNHTFVSSEKLSTSSAGSLVNIGDVPTANPGQGSHLGLSSDEAVDSQPHRDQVYSSSWNDMKIASSNKILYMKPKLNKLVATKSLSDQAKITETNKALTSSGYFKRKRNQLVRSSLGNSFAHVTSVCSVDAASEDHGTTQGLMPSWKCYRMVIPQLFPWKRPSYWRKLMKTSIGPNGRSFPASSQRLKLLRKRDAVYTRSKHGLSLRRSKILSIGGASLKWSNSIERRSKKVNEEATRAVLEAQKGRREEKASTSLKTEKENNDSRGRIFRIGSQRYMMDPSRRTLQRLPDEESSKPTASETKKLLTKLYVPRRLLIGNDEYVRIGNGNQLIRNPKRRSRLIASEKVRWSLHTARQRLGKKKKYCQFFTRFGKCNKDGGKCPYIHDPSKIAVCTKFLNDLCSIKDCKLTHKIIPERMPDCSFFLQGLCANKNCPYRHVNVNPKAPTCEAFLRGYCMDGNECRKKHSYVCPVFGATGNCPQGSKCKFHHPKAPNKGKKRKRSREKKNVRDRYFGNMGRRLIEPGASITEKPLPVTHGETLDLPDYIALGSSDDEAGDGGGIGDGASDPSDLPCGDLDGLIKPLGLRELDMTTS